MKYIVYNKTGKILRTGSCPVSMLNSQAHKNEFVMEGVANDVKHKIVKGNIVKKQTNEIEVIAHQEQDLVIANILSRLENLEAKFE